jgi:hypothetical protein
MSADAYDVYCDIALLDGARIAPVFGIFAGVDGWRVAETDLCGSFVVQVYECERLGEALAAARLLNMADALKGRA